MSESMLQTRLDALFADKYPALLAISADSWFADEDTLTSYEHVELIAALEDAFGIEIRDDEMIEENFGSREAILKYLQNAGFSRAVNDS